MNCWRAGILMAAFTDGELSAAEAEAMREHLAGCDDCRTAHDAVRAVPDIDLVTFDEAVEAELWDELDRRIAEGLSDRKRRPLAPSGARVLRSLPSMLWHGELTVPNAAAAIFVAAFITTALFALGQSRESQRLTAELANRDQAIQLMAQAMDRRQPVRAEPVRVDEADGSTRPAAGARPNAPAQAADPDFAPDGDTRPVGDQSPVGPVRTF